MYSFILLYSLSIDVTKLCHILTDLCSILFYSILFLFYFCSILFYSVDEVLLMRNTSTSVADWLSCKWNLRFFLVFLQAAYPPNHYIRRCPQRKIHLFTFCQLVQLGVMCFFGFSPWAYVKMVFPVIILLLLPVRFVTIPRTSLLSFFLFFSSFSLSSEEVLPVFLQCS